MLKFGAVFLGFMVYVQLLMVHYNLGNRFNMGQTLAPALGALFIAIGFFLKGARRNWFFGIRTPWTMGSEKVWRKTHELGSKLFIISGAISILGLVFPDVSIWLVIVPVILSALAAVAYSYAVFAKGQKG